MGCVLCNITRVPYFGTDNSPNWNPFYCSTPEEESQFYNELVEDIVIRHKDIAQLIADKLSVKVK